MPFFPEKHIHNNTLILLGKTATTLLQGDCQEFLKNLKPKSIDLIVTSPPYDNLREYGKISTWNFDVFKKIAPLLYNVMKDNSTMVWVVGDSVVKGSETGTSFKQALFFMETGYKLHDTMIYKKPGVAFPDKTRYSNTFEYMFILTKGAITFNPIKDRRNKKRSIGEKYHGSERCPNGLTKKKNKPTPKKTGVFGIRTNIWEISNYSPPGTVHPAIFPLQLAADHIKSWSNPGDNILDPFMGSGTTGKAAKLLGRNFIGIEINPEYFEIARKNI